MRVATRRLRAALELQGRRALVGDLRALCQALGLARDLHLVEGIPPMRAWGRAQAAAARREVRRQLGSARTRGLLLALRQVPGAPGPGARRELRRRERQVAAALEALDRAEAGGRPDALHRLRRRVRRLRYAREALGVPAGVLPGVQEALGAACDLLALRRLVARWAEDTGEDAAAALARLDHALKAPDRRPVRNRAPSP